MPKLNIEGLIELAKAITKEEVLFIVQGMKRYKAQGLDGFQVIFFKIYWDIVGGDI